MPVPAVSSFDIESRRIVYEVIDIRAPWRAGSKETVIFHHGLAMDRKMWSDWLPALLRDYRLVVFDMFGFGESRPSGSGAGDWSPQARVRDLLALANEVGAGTFHLIGESYGGTIALMAAMRAPERISSLTIANASHIGSSIRNVDWWQELIDEEGMEGWARRMMADRFFPETLTPEMAEWYLERQATCTREAVLSTLRELVGLDLADDVGAIATPSLLLLGDSSPFVPVPIMDDLKNRLKNARLKVVPRARHGLPFSHGSECGEAARAFLASCSGTAAPA